MLVYTTKSPDQHAEAEEPPGQKLRKVVEFFQNENSFTSSRLMANPLIRTEDQLLFASCLARLMLEDLTSHDKLKQGDNSLKVYDILAQYMALNDAGLS